MDAHIVSHIAIFAAYVMACFMVPPAFRALIFIRPLTMIAGAGFFATCAVTHLSVSLDMSQTWWAQADAHIQAVFIISFLVFLSQDLGRALARLNVAFQRLYKELDDPKEGAKVAQIIKDSLGGDYRDKSDKS